MRCTLHENTSNDIHSQIFFVPENTVISEKLHLLCLCHLLSKCMAFVFQEALNEVKSLVKKLSHNSNTSYYPGNWWGTHLLSSDYGHHLIAFRTKTWLGFNSCDTKLQNHNWNFFRDNGSPRRDDNHLTTSSQTLKLL